MPDSTLVNGMRNIALENVDISPDVVDMKNWLLLNKDIQTELDGAVHNIYNSKHDQAEKQFRSLRRRYPQHPMPYFLMGLSTWWKIMPSNVTNTIYDKTFFAYMDTAITKGERLYDIDNKNYEACFFLAAAYGFDARLHAERHDLRKATISSKRALDYLDKSKEANGLSPEFLLGQGLFNYYAAWISEEHPWLRPILLLFPKGNRQLGLQQIKSVADNGFYAGPEAKFFLMKILGSERENNSAAALQVARKLATEYPDNGYFERYYAMLCFNNGEHRKCEQVSLDILDKLNRGMPGYEGFSGRYATYYLGWLNQNKYKDSAKAKDYFQRCVVFSEATGQTGVGYYVHANYNLAKIAEEENNVSVARRYFQVVLEKAERKSDIYNEAKDYLKNRKLMKASSHQSNAIYSSDYPAKKLSAKARLSALDVRAAK
ncbi:tetratricopeptide repeat protein [Hymenobacter sp. BT186]|uniref:Tetratricopeptide repeat protein n=1 Tax=Hymenobacter telluris TaxID=2816474 RepID=A0A939F257_9BACT|nr:tetratricopeptide repeat protein [Hymenobacter telluris]MBO0360967.1 tetratricopeptide repeat protein [Hymenobacter telluris]MBW3376995.1 tetratricopeptide repeat protein [Hymenobacter norwichensis]